MADIGNLHFGVHLQDYTDAEADKIKKKLENLSVSLKIDGNNVSVTNTDAIKKQIEAAVKSVSVSSFKVDASDVQKQLQAATQNSSAQVKVTFLQGSLSNDIQAYLDTKTFKINISILKAQAQKDISAALATISVPVNVKVSANAVLQQLQQSLANRRLPIDVEAKDVKGFVQDLETKLGKRNVKIGLDVNKTTLKNNIVNALKGQTFSADLKLNIKTVDVQDAIRQAFAQAGMQYNTTASDLRAARIAEIQQRMALRAANAQRRLGDAYRHSASGAYESARASVTLGRSFHTNIRLAGELGTILGNFASMFGIKDLLYNMVQIGGQLENQRIALGAILQDGGKATEMFSKIESLAVKSPFGIMDLNQYTKQLAAYSIPYNELYDTMKRLADISAGVGVDMGRIVLAFGQVRAAGFLKGTELRQFTEANIPMVDKLAERFSVLERRIVSAAEVYDMISKKKITFEDVKAVLWDLTDEGGMFNDMQGVLSESLASKWKNLADAMDVMYGKIADGGIGSTLKWTAEMLTELTKQWEYLSTAITTAAGAYLTYKATLSMQGTRSMFDDAMANKRKEAAALRLARTYRTLTSEEQALINTTGRLTIADVKRLARLQILNKEEALRLIALRKLDAATLAYVQRIYGLTDAQVAAAASSTRFGRSLVSLKNMFIGFGSALKSVFTSPWTWIFAGITAIAELWTWYDKKQDEIEERNNKFVDSMKGSAMTLEEELVKMESVDIGKLNDDEIKTKIKSLSTVIKNEADGWQSILSEVFAKEADDSFVHSAEEQLRMLKIKMDELAKAKKKLMEDPSSYSDVIGATESGILFWEEDVIDKLKKYSEAVEENDKKLKKLGMHARDVSAALKLAASGNEELMKSMEGKPLNEQVTMLRDFETERNKFLVGLTKTNQDAVGIVNSWFNSILKGDVKTSETNLKESLAQAKDAMVNELSLKGEDSNKLTETGRQYVWKIVDGMIEEGGVQKPRIQQEIYDLFAGWFNLPKNDLSFKVPDVIGEDGTVNDDGGKDKKDAVAEMWKKRASEIEKAVKMYDDWKKVEGKLLAENRVKYNEELANLFNGSYGFNLDLEDPTEAYEYIREQLNEAMEKQKELKVQLGVKVSDANLKDAKEDVDRYLGEMKEYIEQTTRKWDLYKQLFEATGDKEFAMTAFKDTQVWDDAAIKMMEKLKEEMETQGRVIELDFTISEAKAKEAFEGKDGLFELWKAIKERIEKNGIDLKVNAGKAIKDTRSVADEIKSLENQRDEDLKQYAEGSKEYDAASKDWEQKIVALRGELFELSPVFKSLFVDTTGMASGKLYELWQKAKALVDLIRQNTTRIVKNADDVVVGRYYTDEKGNEQYIAEESFNKLETQTEKLAKKVPAVKVAFDNLWNAIRGEGKEGYKFKDVAEDVSILAKEAADASQSLSSMFDSLGNEGLADAFGLGSSILGGVGDIASGFASGNPFAVLGGVTGIIGSIAQAHDKKLDKAIKKSQLEVQKLSNAYSQIETIIDRQLGSVTSTQSKQMIANLEKQRNELSKQYQLEDEKKKTDKSKLEDYKHQIAELNDQISYFYEDLANEQYGVDLGGWASQISEALTEAFANGEDAAKAFDETVGNILKSLATEAIRLQFIEPAMENLRKYLFGDNGIFTDQSELGSDLSASEAGALAAELEKLKAQISSSNNYWDKINEAVGGILDSTESASGGLSKGIQSVTEDTADLLASYLNAIRGDVSVKRSLIEKLIVEDVPKMNYLAEAQLQQLQMIVTNTKRNADVATEIRDLFNRVVDKGSNKLKV